MQERQKRAFSRATDRLEETLIAIFMGLMTLITFANVVARYVFNSNILWALELTVFLFAWLVLIGVSYGVKTMSHLGVDVVVNFLPRDLRKIVTLVAVAACIIFSVLLMKGAWDYWYPFATKRAWLETDDIPMPDMLQFLATWLNEGEHYEKLPRFIPYFALPLGVALMLLRFLQLGWLVITDRAELIIAGHEAEELMEEVAQSSSTER